MSIKEIEQIYSLYGIDVMHSSDLLQSPTEQEVLFPDRIKPPSAFIADDQIIDNVSNP